MVLDINMNIVLRKYILEIENLIKDINFIAITVIITS